ncbi:MAG: feruloyl-CoA synthase [Betaproteobacteria bacterium]|nr:MAG: feruloyl-CoA synthase [Betaproteobacteria bacterium]
MLQSSLRFAPAEVNVEKRPDGSSVLRSPQKLGAYARCVTEWLVHWSDHSPERVFLAERSGEGWRRISYRESYGAVRRIGQALLNLGLNQGRPVAILSDNSIDHALLALGAMHVGVPVAPISPAYSLMSRDFGKLKSIFELVQPGLTFVSDAEKYKAALAAVGAKPTSVAELLETNPGSTMEREFAKVKPESVAKILFTSGSTGAPKGVINTHRMLCANQQMLAQAWPFVEDRPPVIVDWLPWNHTFGGNHNFNLLLRNGGTLYIDGGKPAPGLAEITARNLKEIAPTLYFNVPRGYDLLLPFLEKDAGLRRNFFSQLDVLFYAAAALPQNLWDRIKAFKPDVVMLSAWGSTETSPLATSVHFHMERPGVIGLPVAGCELKLVPSAGKMEVRVRGPNVMPGYYKREDLTRAAFDGEGFYRIGDAVKFADPADAAKGIVFDGRVAEDFKLSTGTWVNAGAVRIRLIAAADPLIQDAVITGHDRDELGALVFLSPAARDLPPEEVRSRLRSVLRGFSGGSSTCPARLMVMSEPPSIDANEITDKGYMNQRAVLERRAALVESLYSGDESVISA